VTLSRSSVAVSGLNTVTVTVMVHLTDPVGVVESSASETGAPLPQVGLSRVSSPGTAGAPSQDSRDLNLASGTGRDGVWTAAIRVPSTYDGSWQVTAVWATNSQDGSLFVDPRKVGITRTLTVRGSRQPSLSLGFSPKVPVGNQAVNIKGRAVDADTGRPLAGILLNLGAGSENCGVFDYGGAGSVTTNAKGYYVFRRAPDANVFCVISTIPPKRGAIDRYSTTTLLYRSGGVLVQPTISASVDHTPIHLGETVAIRGSVAPSTFVYPGVFLQRYSGGHWRTVGTAHVRASGRYTAYATPPTRGNHRYRVHTQAYFNRLPAYSRVVLVGAS